MCKVLSEEQIKSNKETFLNVLRSTNREGIEELISWLVGTDFFEAPASTKYNGDFEGGLCLHTLNVCRAALKLKETLNELSNGKFSQVGQDSIIIATLLHDMCKVNSYQPVYKSVKDASSGMWKQYIGYDVLQTMPVPHSLRSIIFITQFIHLSAEEYTSIAWHMGMTRPDRYICRDDVNQMNDAVAQYPLVLLLMMANAASVYEMDYTLDPKTIAE